MERAAPHVTGWPAEILGSGYRDMPDAAHDVSACVAANAETYGLHRHAHGAGYTGAGLLHTVASRKRLERALDRQDLELFDEYGGMQEAINRYIALGKLPEAELAEGVSIDGYSTFRATRFSEPA